MGYHCMEKMIDFLVKIIVRAIVGVAIIFFLNMYLESKEIDVHVGINPITVTTSGVLGTPGVALLYGIAAYRGF